MQAHMNFTQYNMLNRKIMMVQAEQNNLMATNMLMMNIQFNTLLENEEAEMGVSKNSEDIGKFIKWFSNLILLSIDAEEDDG
mgnify:CR=1 FL=1